MAVDGCRRMVQICLAPVMAMILMACSDGGGRPPFEPTVVYTPEIFEPSSRFDNLCENPRTGIDPDTGFSFADAQGSFVDENNWLRSWSHELYLWYDEIIDVDPSSTSTPAYFDLMKTFALTGSGAPRDKFHFSLPTDEWRALSQSGISAGYGAEFAILESTPPRRVVVAYTEPGSPATDPSVALQRGAILLEVDGVDVVNGNSQSEVNVLNAGIFPADSGETHNFKIEDTDGTVRNIVMTSSTVTSDPVQAVSIITTASGPVGYMLFNDHIATSEAQLISAVNYFAAQGIVDLILDIRYNSGGFLDIANEMAFMVAGAAAASGRTFDEIQFNDKHVQFNPVTGQQLLPTTFHTTTQGFSATAGDPLPSLNLLRLFVLTGPGTCSASEAIMNGLRGVDIEVIQIGSTTCGKPYGFYAFDNCGTTYFSIQFRGVNDKGFGDYTDGFSPVNQVSAQGTTVPGCSVADDFSKPLGDPLESRVSAALAYRVDGSCPAATGATLPSILSQGLPPPLSAVDGEVSKNFFLSNRIMGP